MITRSILMAAVIAAGAFLSADAMAYPLGKDNGRPDWAGNGNGASFETTTTETDTGFMLSLVHLTPSGNEKTTTLTYGTTADGQNILLEMQKLFTNHNGNTVSISRVFNVLPEPEPAPEPVAQVGATATTTP